MNDTKIIIWHLDSEIELLVGAADETLCLFTVEVLTSTSVSYLALSWYRDW